MTISDRLQKYLDEAREPEHRGPRGEHVFSRDDDVPLAAYISHNLNTMAEPAVFTDGGFWRYAPKTGAWAELERDEVKRAVMGLSGMQRFVKKDPNTGVLTTSSIHMSASRCNGIVELCETFLGQRDFFAGAEAGLCFANGFVAVAASGVDIRAKDPKWRVRTALPFAYREDHQRKAWDGFLSDIFRGDEDADIKRQFLQEVMGTALLGACTIYDKAVILWGEGSNGKSVFLDVVQKLFPARNLASIAPQNFGEEYYKARLDGVVLNVVSELPSRDLVDTPAMKAIISGDLVTARRPRENPFDFRPKAGHFFAVNPPMPSVGDFSRGFWRRFTVVTFNRSFEADPERRDRHALEADLAKELPGIAAWALLGAVQVKARGGYVPVPSSDAFLGLWHTNTNQVAGFVRDECELTVGPDITKMASDDELYKAYRAWAERTGHRMTLSLSKFGERLALLGHRAKQDGSKHVRPLMLTGRTPVRYRALSAVSKEPSQPDLPTGMPDWDDEDDGQN